MEKKQKVQFERKGGFPGVIGCLDGTHIPIKGPSTHSDLFINRKGYASFQLQAVCDRQLRFTHIQTGNAGSVHDSRVYRNSDLKAILTALPLPPQYHLLVDSAYPLDTNLHVPYRDNGHLTEHQNHYNNVHSSTRVHIVRAFGLKCKWRKLHYLDMVLLETIPKVIASTCVLHNFILIHEGEDGAVILDADVIDDVIPAVDGPRVEQRRVAQQKREEIAARL